MTDPRVEPLAQVFRLNTRLFRNVLAELDEVDATARPNGQTNSVAFIAGHLVESRAWTARYLGADVPAPFGGALEHAASLADVARLPRLGEIRSAWDAVSDPFERRLAEVGAPELDAPGSERFPGVDGTRLGGLAFLLQHESYHLGQLGYLRRFLGLPAMSYK
ncbi:MAG: DinB family protein [Gemmatimonadales bacterium]